jgi:hypothetical protein
MNTALGVGRGGLELHLMFSAYLATEGPILSRSREHSLVELLEMPATELGRVERASRCRVSPFDSESGSRRDTCRGGTPAPFESSSTDRPFLLLAGECLSLDWRGHAVEIAVGDLSADEPDRNQHHASRWAHVSFPREMAVRRAVERRAVPAVASEMTIHWRALRRYPITTPHSRPPPRVALELGFTRVRTRDGGHRRIGARPDAGLPRSMHRDCRHRGPEGTRRGDKVCRGDAVFATTVGRACGCFDAQSAYRDLAKAHALHETGCRRLDDLAGGDGLGRCFAAPGPFLRAVFHEYSIRRGTRRARIALDVQRILGHRGADPIAEP